MTEVSEVVKVEKSGNIMETYLAVAVAQGTKF